MGSHFSLVSADSATARLSSVLTAHAITTSKWPTSVRSDMSLRCSGSACSHLPKTRRSMGNFGKARSVPFQTAVATPRDDAIPIWGAE